MLTNEELDELLTIRNQIEALRLRHEQIVKTAASRNPQPEPQQLPEPTVPENQNLPKVVQSADEQVQQASSPNKNMPTITETAEEIEANSKDSQYWHADRNEAPIELPTHIPRALAMELLTNASCAD